MSSLVYSISVKTLHVGEFKSTFSEVLNQIRKGEEIAIAFGKKKEKVAVLLPYLKYKRTKKRKLGILKNKASFSFGRSFKITEKELLES